MGDVLRGVLERDAETERRSTDRQPTDNKQSETHQEGSTCVPEGETHQREGRPIINDDERPADELRANLSTALERSKADLQKALSEARGEILGGLRDVHDCNMRIETLVKDVAASSKREDHMRQEVQYQRSITDLERETRQQAEDDRRKAEQRLAESYLIMGLIMGEQRRTGLRS